MYGVEFLNIVSNVFDIALSLNWFYISVLSIYFIIVWFGGQWKNVFIYPNINDTIPIIRTKIIIDFIIILYIYFYYINNYQ